MNDAHLHQCLLVTEHKIIRLKREAFEKFGRRRKDWSASTVAQFERLKEMAKGIRQQIEVKNGE